MFSSRRARPFEISRFQIVTLYCRQLTSGVDIHPNRRKPTFNTSKYCRKPTKKHILYPKFFQNSNYAMIWFLCVAFHMLIPGHIHQFTISTIFTNMRHITWYYPPHLLPVNLCFQHNVWTKISTKLKCWNTFLIENWHLDWIVSEIHCPFPLNRITSERHQHKTIAAINHCHTANHKKNSYT